MRPNRADKYSTRGAEVAPRLPASFLGVKIMKTSTVNECFECEHADVELFNRETLSDDELKVLCGTDTLCEECLTERIMDRCLTMDEDNWAY